MIMVSLQNREDQALETADGLPCYPSVALTATKMATLVVVAHRLEVGLAKTMKFAVAMVLERRDAA